MQPGSPAREELDSGSVIPMEQTSISVQFDQVLTTLQAPVREDLQIFLQGVRRRALRPADGGGEGFRESFRTSPAAYRYTAAGQRGPPRHRAGRPGRLRSQLRRPSSARSTTTRSSSRTWSPTCASSPARSPPRARRWSRRSHELPRALAEGRPALAKLNAAFPAAARLRARGAARGPGRQQGARTAQPVHRPASQPRLQAGAARPGQGPAPDDPAARAARPTPLPFLEEARALSSCFNNVVIPWGNTDDPRRPTASTRRRQVYKETGYGLTGIAGESRSGDANGQYFRVPPAAAPTRS